MDWSLQRLCGRLLFMAGLLLPCLCHADGATLEAWRKEVGEARVLAENDEPSAYREAERLQAAMPKDALAADRARILNLRARIEMYLGQTDKAAQHAGEAFVIAHGNNDRTGQIEADLNIALVAINQGRLEDMVQATQDGMDLVDGEDRMDLRAETMFHASMMYFRFGHLDESATVAMQLLDIVKNSRDQMAHAYGEQAMAITYAQSGRYNEAREHYGTMLEIAKAANSLLLQADAKLGLAEMNVTISNPTVDETERQFQESIALYRHIGAPLSLSHALFQLSNQFLMHGKPDKALPLLNEIASVYESRDNVIGLWWTLNERSQVLQKLGRLDEALKDAQREDRIAQGIGFAIYRAGSARRLSELAAAQGDFRDAYRRSREAIELDEKAEKETSGKRITELARRFQEESKQRQIDDLTRHNKEQNAQQLWLATVLAGSCILLGGTVFFIFRLRASRRKIEEANADLRKSREKKQAILNAIPDLLFELDLEGRYHEVYASRPELLAAPAHGLAGKTVFDVLPAEAAQNCIKAVCEAYVNGSSTGVQIEIPLPEGAQWFELSTARKAMAPGEDPHFIVLSRDITERIEAERLLHEKNEAIRAIVENSPDLILRYDTAYRRIYMNPAMQRVFNLPPEEVLGKSVLDHAPLPDMAEYLRLLKLTMQTATEHRAEMRLSSTGSQRWMDLRFVPEFDPDGKLASVLAISRDITERKLAEQELRLKEYILDHASEAIYIRGPDYRFIYVNKAACEALKYRREELLGMTPLDINVDTSPEQLQYLKDQMALCGSVRLEARHRRSDGTIFPVELQINQVEYNGKTMAVTFVRDIAERKAMEDALARSEREFRTLVEHIPDFIVRYNLDLCRTYVNPVWERASGLAAEQVVNVPASLTPIVAKPAIDEYYAAVREAIRTESVKEAEFVWVNTQGSPMTLSCVIVPEFDRHGKVSGALCVGHDVTQLREAERMLRYSYGMLQELTIRREEAREEERKRIARDLHDELGQILTVLRMEIAVLRMKFGQDNPALTEQVKEIMGRVDSTIQVVRNVATRLRPAVLDTGIVSALEWQVEEFTRKTGVHCELELEANQIQMSEEHATTVFRIVQESLTNVARHSGADRAEISLCREGEYYLLEVRDNGTGFDPDTTGNKTFGLMGIRERALALKGEVTFDSQPGRGTRIRVRIPMEK